MKTRWARILSVVLISLFVAATSYAGMGHGSGQGDGAGGGPIHDIFAGTPFECEGTVIDYAFGNGLTLSVLGDDNYIIYGIGPERFWENLGLYRPAVGDAIAVEGYAVDFNGEIRNIATFVTLESGEEVNLRDSETGRPLWRAPGPRPNNPPEDEN